MPIVFSSITPTHQRILLVNCPLWAIPPAILNYLQEGRDAMYLHDVLTSYGFHVHHKTDETCVWTLAVSDSVTIRLAVHISEQSAYCPCVVTWIKDGLAWSMRDYKSVFDAICHLRKVHGLATERQKRELERLVLDMEDSDSDLNISQFLHHRRGM